MVLPDSCVNQEARVPLCNLSCREQMARRMESIDEIDEELSRLKCVELAFKARRNRLVPISSLPEEILCRIFLESQIYDRKHRKAWFAMSHVCSYWRSVALSCPALWSKIHFQGPRWMAELLSRTSSTAIPLWIATASDNNEQLRNVSNHITRVRELHTGWCTILRLVEEGLKKTHTPLLQLEHLTLEALDVPISRVADIFVHGVPHLRRLQLTFFHTGTVLLSPLPKTLTHLDISKSQVNARCLLAGLRGLTQLERLAVYLEDEEPPENLSTVELKSLQHVRINGRYTDVQSMLFQHLSFPSHTTVNIHSHNIIDIEDLLHNLNKARNAAAPVIAPCSFDTVRSIEIRIMMGRKDAFYMRCFKSDDTSLENDRDMSYDFWLDDPHPFELILELDGWMNVAETMTLILSSPLKFPAVTSVLVSGIRNSPHWRRIFDAFPNLQLLQICFTPLDDLVDDLMPRTGDTEDSGVVVPAPALKKLVLREVTFPVVDDTLWGAMSCITEVGEWLVYDPIQEFVHMLNARAGVNAALDSLVLREVAKSSAQRLREMVPCAVTLD